MVELLTFLIYSFFECDYFIFIYVQTSEQATVSWGKDDLKGLERSEASANWGEGKGERVNHSSFSVRSRLSCFVHWWFSLTKAIYRQFISPMKVLTFLLLSALEVWSIFDILKVTIPCVCEKAVFHLCILFMPKSNRH